MIFEGVSTLTSLKVGFHTAAFYAIAKKAQERLSSACVER